MPMTSKPPHDRVIAAEAAAWIAQLQRPDRDADLENAFRGWLRSDPAHAAAFEDATMVWHQLPGVGAMYRERTGHRSRWKQFAVAASVMLVAGALLLMHLLSGEVYVTAVGEQRLVKLQDGSWISMNTDTVVKTRYGTGERYVALERGEAIFDVAKDADRPFVVATGDERVRALGTSFAVRRDAATVSVLLLEGTVAIEPPRPRFGGRKVKPTQMLAGQGWRSQDNAVTQLTEAHLGRLTAWRHGELVFDAMTLRDAIVEMNRYSVRPLVIQTPAAGTLPITGVFRIRESEEFARTVAALYGLRVTADDRQILLSGSPGVTAP
jgi:transmembrane sensor